MIEDARNTTTRRAVCTSVAALAILASGCNGEPLDNHINFEDDERVDSYVTILNNDSDEPHEIRVVVETVTTGERLRDETLVVEPGRDEDGIISDARETIRFSTPSSGHEDVDEAPTIEVTVTLTDTEVSDTHEWTFGSTEPSHFSVRLTSGEVDISVYQL